MKFEYSIKVNNELFFSSLRSLYSYQSNTLSNLNMWVQTLHKLTKFLTNFIATLGMKKLTANVPS